jgi:hypothetical protein
MLRIAERPGLPVQRRCGFRDQSVEKGHAEHCRRFDNLQHKKQDCG